jgi:hypothetical protein
MIRILTNRSLPPFVAGRPGARAPSGEIRGRTHARTEAAALLALERRRRSRDVRSHAELGLRAWMARPYGT